MITRTVARLSLDIFMSYHFLNVLWLLILMKRQSLPEEQFERRHKIVIAVIIFEFCVFVANSLIKNVIVMLFTVSYFPQNFSNSPVLTYFLVSFKDILDMCLYLGLLYLFHY